MGSKGRSQTAAPLPMAGESWQRLHHGAGAGL